MVSPATPRRHPNESSFGRDSSLVAEPPAARERGVVKGGPDRDLHECCPKPLRHARPAAGSPVLGRAFGNRFVFGASRPALKGRDQRRAGREWLSPRTGAWRPGLRSSLCPRSRRRGADRDAFRAASSSCCGVTESECPLMQPDATSGGTTPPSRVQSRRVVPSEPGTPVGPLLFIP